MRRTGERRMKRWLDLDLGREERFGRHRRRRRGDIRVDESDVVGIKWRVGRSVLPEDRADLRGHGEGVCSHREGGLSVQLRK